MWLCRSDAMTEISFETFSVRARGHSGAGTRGNDIVCAAVSVLVQALAQSLYDNMDLLRCFPRFEKGDGWADVSCTPDDGCEDQVRRMFSVARAGVALLQARYPANVKIVENVREKS